MILFILFNNNTIDIYIAHISTVHGVQGAPTIYHVKDWHLSFPLLLPVTLQDSDQMDVDGDPVTRPALICH